MYNTNMFSKSSSKDQSLLSDVGIDYPLVLLGGPGSGKSAIAARTADVAAMMAAKKDIYG